MANAFGELSRIHAPLLAPLKDCYEPSARYKSQWPCSFAKLMRYLTEQSRDYSCGQYDPIRGAEDLIVLNLYMTETVSTAYGFGPSPCEPLCLSYAIPHPSDVDRQSLLEAYYNSRPRPLTERLPDEISKVVSTKRHSDDGNSADEDEQKPKVRQLPFLCQTFLDRENPATRKRDQLVCVRLADEFINLSLEGHKFVNCTDVSAGTVYWNPTLAAAEKRMAWFPGKDDRKVPIDSFITNQECDGEKGIPIIFMPSNKQRGRASYWWVHENKSWCLVVRDVESIGDRPGEQKEKPLTEKLYERFTGHPRLPSDQRKHAFNDRVYVKPEDRHPFKRSQSAPSGMTSPTPDGVRHINLEKPHNMSQRFADIKFELLGFMHRKKKAPRIGEVLTAVERKALKEWKAKNRPRFGPTVKVFANEGDIKNLMAEADFTTGQMCFWKGLHPASVDLLIAIMTAIVNLEVASFKEGEIRKEEKAKESHGWTTYR